MRAALLALLFVLCFGSAWSAGPKHPKADPGNEKPKQEQRGFESDPLFVKGEITTKKDEKEAEEDAAERKAKSAVDESLVKYTGHLALATYLLFIFTAALFGVTSYLAWHAHKDFIASHRPRLVVRRVSIKRAQATGGISAPTGVEFVIANVGDNKARIVERSLKLWVAEPAANLPANPPYGESVPMDMTVDSGEYPPITHWEQALSVERFNMLHALGVDVRKVEVPVHFVGYIVYTDELKRTRRTAFLRRYNFKTGRFDAVEHPDYEYQD